MVPRDTDGMRIGGLTRCVIAVHGLGLLSATGTWMWIAAVVYQNAEI